MNLVWSLVILVPWTVTFGILAVHAHLTHDNSHDPH